MDVRVLENRVNQIVNRVVGGHSVEDDLVQSTAALPQRGTLKPATQNFRMPHRGARQQNGRCDEEHKRQKGAV